VVDERAVIENYSSIAPYPEIGMTGWMSIEDVYVADLICT
jgi:hypothetical protein